MVKETHLEETKDLFTQDLKELTAGFINGTIKDIPPYKTLGVMRRLWAMKHWTKMKELSELCKGRLEAKGLVYLTGYGWAKKNMVPYMGLVQKNGQWIIGDLQKFREFNLRS